MQSAFTITFLNIDLGRNGCFSIQSKSKQSGISWHM